MDAAEDPSKPTPKTAPLLSTGPVNHGNNKGKSINSVETLSTALVEPECLQQTRDATFADDEMKNFVDLAQILSP